MTLFPAEVPFYVGLHRGVRGDDRGWFGGERGEVEKGSSGGGVGCGGVGLNVIQGARLCGAGRIIAIDVHAASLEKGEAVWGDGQGARAKGGWRLSPGGMPRSSR